MTYQIDWKAYAAALGLFLSIVGSVLNLPVTPTLPGASGATSSPVASPSPTVTPSVAPAAELSHPGFKQKILWAYSFSPDTVPDLSYLKLEKGVSYVLFDKNHRCVGLLTPKGSTKWHNTQLIHRYPELCGGSTNDQL